MAIRTKKHGRECLAPAKHAGSTTLPEVLPHASPEPITPTTGTWTKVPPLVRTGAFELGRAQLTA